MSNSTPLTIRDFGGEPYVFMRYPEPEDQRWSAFNPSIARSPDGRYCVTIRSSNYVIRDDNGITELLSGSYIKNRMWFADVDPETLQISSPREVRFVYPPGISVTRGVEDARLYWRESSWHFIAVIFEPPMFPLSRLATFRFDETTNVATMLEVLPGVHPKMAEKNWIVPDQPTEAFDYLYSTTVAYKGGQVLSQPTNMARSIILGDYLSSLRGGTQLLLQPDGTYLSILHDVSMNKQKFFNPRIFASQFTYDKKYRHYFARFSAEGKLTHLSSAFFFKVPAIEYAAGMAEYEDSLIISFGGKDAAACLTKIAKDHVVENLLPISS